MYSQRLERLYDLARMVHVDHHIGDSQEIMLRRLGLGFTVGDVNYIIAKALSLVDKKVDLDTFTFEIQNMNK